MTPGQYLKLRRQRAGLSIEDVATMVDSTPRVGEIDRIAWIRRVEDDIAALGPDVIISLARAYQFSRSVLMQLIDRRSYGSDFVTLPRICMSCGCSIFDPCCDKASGKACAWSSANADICTSCSPEELPHA